MSNYVDPWGGYYKGMESLNTALSDIEKSRRLDIAERRQAELDRMAKEDWEFKKAERERTLADTMAQRTALAEASKPYQVTTANPEYGQYKQTLAAAMGPPVPQEDITRHENMSPAEKASYTALGPEIESWKASNLGLAEANQALPAQAPPETLTSTVTPHPIKAQVEAGKALMARGNPLGQSMLAAAQKTMHDEFTTLISLGDFGTVAKLYSDISGQNVTPFNKDQYKIGEHSIVDFKGIQESSRAGVPFAEAVKQNTFEFQQKPPTAPQEHYLRIKSLPNPTPEDLRYIAAYEAEKKRELEGKKELKTTVVVKPYAPAPVAGATGLLFDKNKDMFYEVGEDGKRIYMSSEQAKNKALSFKEETPTADTRTMQQSVPSVLGMIEKIRSNLDNTTTGPMASRYQEFMAGKIGAPNEDFTKLRTNTGLLYTRLMKMHVGSRGGEKMMEHFKGLIDSGKQSPENMKAALDAIESYANDVQSHKISGEVTTGSSDSKPIAPKGTKVPKKGGGFYTSDGKGGWK